MANEAEGLQAIINDHIAHESTPIIEDENNLVLSTPIFPPAKKIKIDGLSEPIFPPEVLMEILSWLPLKTLSKFQLVCKEWRSWIHDHYFIEKHMDHSPVIHYWHNVYYRSSSCENHDSFSYIHGCDGLVLLLNKTTDKYCLWNPATCLFLELPGSGNDRDLITFSFVPATKNYRVVSVYKEKGSGRGGFDIFTPGESKEWRHLAFPDNVSVNKNKGRENVSIVASGGAVHCVTKVGQENGIRIVSLDLETEHFTTNHFPKLGSVDGWKNFWDLDWDGKLVFADIVGRNLEVIELEDYKKQRWCEEKKVVHLPFLKKDDKGGKNVFPLFARKGEIWFWLEDEKIFTYSIGTGKLNDIKESRKFVVSDKLYPYKPSLITFEGMLAADRKKFESVRIDFD